MSTKESSTTDHPTVKGHPKCFKCEKYVKCAVRNASTDEHWQIPCGILLTGGDNFGSKIYDALVDGIWIEIILCDDCLEKNKHLLRKTKRHLSCDYVLDTVKQLEADVREYIERKKNDRKSRISKK